MKKKCSQCKQKKVRDDFFDHKDKPDGKQNVCKKCSGDNRRRRFAEKKLYGENLFIG